MAVADDLDRATDSKWDWVAEHTRTYLASGGTEGHESNGVYTLVLATTGRRTGEPRRTCLIYGTSGDDCVVVASKGGADEDPAWFKNLQADPSVGVQVGTRRFTAVACQRDGTTGLPRPRDHLGVDVMVIGSPRWVNQDTPVGAVERVWPGRWRRR
jgi:deazaflavin-dependent oxidoreductase (nitroreductase family)